MRNTINQFHQDIQSDLALFVCPSLMEDPSPVLSVEDIKKRVDVSNIQLQLILENLPQTPKNLILLLSDQPAILNR